MKWDIFSVILPALIFLFGFYSVRHGDIHNGYTLMLVSIWYLLAKIYVRIIMKEYKDKKMEGRV